MTTNSSVAINIKDCSILFPETAGLKSFKNKLLMTAIGQSAKVRPERQHLLGPISLEIKKGENVAILGENGAGKSSLLRLISGIYTPTSGISNIFGSVVSMIDIHAGVKDEMTGRNNAKMLMRFFGNNINRSQNQNKVLENIKEFSGLEDAFEKPIATYSSGMRLRLVFSTVTLQRADIVLMDEWLSVGDHAFLKKVNLRLKQVVDDAHIFLLATHSQETALELCERGIVLKNGRILFDGSIKDACDFYFL